MLKEIYKRWVFKYPMQILALLLVGLFSFGYYATKLEIDASSETLLLDDDADLQFSREMAKHFKGENFLVITYQPYTPMLSNESLESLKKLSDELLSLPLVKSVDSILTVPLLLSPPKEIKELVNDVKTLSNNKDVDKALVRKEFLSSPLYRGNLVSENFKTSAIIVNLVKDNEYKRLLEERNRLQLLTHRSPKEEQYFQKVLFEFKAHRDQRRIIEHQNIEDIRSIMLGYNQGASLFLGGINMITNDIVTYVQSDLWVYGGSLFLILIFVLWSVFRSIRWVVLPLLISLLSVLAVTSLLGFLGLEITVISSNFIALQLIITLSIVLHLIVRYNELLTKYPNSSNYRLTLLTVLSKATPTFFAILTTIIGFSSLVVSNIKPIINLGLMMSAGIAISLFLSFIIFPIILIKLPKLKAKKDVQVQKKFNLIDTSIEIVKKDKKAIFITTGIILLFSITGANRLIVENSFINYFKQDTEIYKGMKVIDEDLGGTTPLDIILTFKEDSPKANADEEIDEFDEEFSESENEAQYWFTKEKMEKIIEVHNYLDQLDEVGTVQSLASILKIGKILNHQKALDGFALGLLYNNLPQEYQKLILSPYINIEQNQVRFATRIIDSNPELRRDKLLKKIRADLVKMVNPQIAEVRLSNLMVLYNNMLQSLFSSQITTLGLVLLLIGIMFLLLFRSLKVALISLGVNIVPISIIFGFMGWFQIPLDIMTITIAAIAIGIGVDDTIHYIHRFEHEYRQSGDYFKALERSDCSIGHAMVYTSLTIMLGFSILVLSNLVPTIYFGLLTVLVMFAALIANLILLPKVLIWLKPFRV